MGYIFQIHSVLFTFLSADSSWSFAVLFSRDLLILWQIFRNHEEHINQVISTKLLKSGPTLLLPNKHCSPAKPLIPMEVIYHITGSTCWWKGRLLKGWLNLRSSVGWRWLICLTCRIQLASGPAPTLLPPCLPGISAQTSKL